jgi:hypothetical protein
MINNHLHHNYLIPCDLILSSKLTRGVIRTENFRGDGALTRRQIRKGTVVFAEIL